jgi:hypothetical protein
VLPAALSIGADGAPGQGELRGEGGNEEGGKGVTRSYLPRSEDDGGGWLAWFRVSWRRSMATAVLQRPAVDGKGWILDTSAS